MFSDKILAQEVLEANREAFVHFTLHDFRVLVETRGLDFVMDEMDEETYRKLEAWFSTDYDEFR